MFIFAHSSASCRFQPCFLFFQQRFHGTPVTIENFLNWKAKFDAELLEIKRKKMKEEEQAGKNKLSGMI